MQFQSHIHGHVILAAMVIPALIPAHFPARGQEGNNSDSLQEIAKAAAVLTSDATREKKVNACRRLAAIGGRESIAPLAALLPAKDLSHAARMGLEAIPHPAAGEALRTALPDLNGGPLIGVINSLAARRETRAVEDLGRYLTHPDPRVAAAACAALGTIATLDSLELLENSLPKLAEEVRPQWANACLRGVAALRDQGLDERAEQLCQLICRAQVPARIHHAATRLSMLIRPDNAGPLLQQLLSSSDNHSFAMALTVSRELDSSKITQVLISSLSALPAARRTQVIRVLGDRGDPTARDALVQFASSNEVALRAAALLALGRTGDVSTIPLLLTAANDSESDVAAAARQAMVTLQGDNIDIALGTAFTESEGTLRCYLIDVIGQRRITSATAELVPLTNATDKPTRLAAIRALGQVLDVPHLPVLTARLTETNAPDERETLQLAIRAACRRAVDRDACARQLQTCLAKLDNDSKPFLIELLGMVGGPTALKTVASLAHASEDSIRDSTTRELGRWRTPDVAPALIDIARTASQEKYRIRALRGYLRVIRQMDLPDTQKLAMFRQAFDAATRNEERVLAIETLGRIPTPEALKEAVNHLEKDPLQDTACAAAVAIAEKIPHDQAAVIVEPMQRVKAVSDDAEIARRVKAVLANIPPGP